MNGRVVKSEEYNIPQVYIEDTCPCKLVTATTTIDTTF